MRLKQDVHISNQYLLGAIECISSLRLNMSRDGDITYDRMIANLVKLFICTRQSKNKAFFIGNGGSAGISMHMTTDFLKNGHLRTHSMHDPATLTCIANDYGYENVFSKQIEMAADAGDVLVAISSSGSSENILRAVRLARNKKCHIVTLTGFAKDNPLSSLGEYNIYVPSDEYGIVESIHQLVLQQVVDELMNQFENERRGGDA